MAALAAGKFVKDQYDAKVARDETEQAAMKEREGSEAPGTISPTQAYDVASGQKDIQMPQTLNQEPPPLPSPQSTVAQPTEQSQLVASSGAGVNQPTLPMPNLTSFSGPSSAQATPESTTGTGTAGLGATAGGIGSTVAGAIPAALDLAGKFIDNRPKLPSAPMRPIGGLSKPSTSISSGFTPQTKSIPQLGMNQTTEPDYLKMRRPGSPYSV